METVANDYLLLNRGRDLAGFIAACFGESDPPNIHLIK